MKPEWRIVSYSMAAFSANSFGLFYSLIILQEDFQAKEIKEHIWIHKLPFLHLVKEYQNCPHDIEMIWKRLLICTKNCNMCEKLLTSLDVKTQKRK